MSKKPARPKKPKISSEQLSLFDLSGFDKEATSPKHTANQAQLKKLSSSAKEAAMALPLVAPGQSVTYFITASL